MPVSPVRASRSRTALRPKSTSTPVSARPSACSPSTSVPGATSIPADSASVRRARWLRRPIAAPPSARAIDFGVPGIGGLPINGNFAKKNASFYEVYGKVNITLNDQFSVGFNEYYSPNFLNLGAWGNYASITGKWTAPSTTFGSSGVGMYISGEFGRQWLGTSDAFYGTTVCHRFAALPERHSGAELQHLEHRRRLHLQGLHAGRPLLRHQPLQGRLQRLHQRLHHHQLQPGLHHRDQSGSVVSAPTGAAPPASSSCRLT